jgi:hypothetical protein
MRGLLFGLLFTFLMLIAFGAIVLLYNYVVGPIDLVDARPITRNFPEVTAQPTLSTPPATVSKTVDFSDQSTHPTLADTPPDRGVSDRAGVSGCAVTSGKYPITCARSIYIHARVPRACVRTWADFGANVGTTRHPTLPPLHPSHPVSTGEPSHV